jgi:hypothetical protein
MVANGSYLIHLCSILATKHRCKIILSLELELIYPCYLPLQLRVCLAARNISDSHFLIRITRIVVKRHKERKHFTENHLKPVLIFELV